MLGDILIFLNFSAKLIQNFEQNIRIDLKVGIKIDDAKLLRTKNQKKIL